MRQFIIVVSVFLCLATQQAFSQVKPKIYYVYDPLCGWCFAYAPIMEKLTIEFKNQVEFVVVPGGMIVGDNVRPIREIAPYLLQAIPQLEEASGVKIGQPYIDMLKEGSYIASSYKPSLALVVFKSFQTGREVEYAHKVQQSYFIDAKDIMGDSLYLDLALQFGVSPEEFMKRMSDTAYQTKTQEHFDFASYLNTKGFPSLVGKSGDSYVKITYGYLSEEESRKKINKFLRKQL
ncbi:MAG: dsbC [Chitinophagaceae bacterium]|nr:dsbC [Chitinophagaceae bacterium]